VVSIVIINEDKWDIILIKNNNNIILNIIFNNYPMISPSIILQKYSEMCNIKTKLINGLDVLDLDILNPTNWKLSIKLVDIMENIINNI
jgi:ubiquitin-protein ligase